MSLPSGTKLGPYEIVVPVGAGGMGEVYRARDTRLGRDVAIKALPDSFGRDPERMRRFEQEARAVAALNHPNVLGIFDTGAHEGIPYLVSELLEGESLRELLKKGPVPARKTVDYAQQIADALAAAHEKNIVHRDLKPENIFVTHEGRAKVLDFGLAKFQLVHRNAAVGEGATITIASGTNPGVVMGTAGYMSPEQVRGDAVDHRSDIFSFGATLYEMLSGERAFKGESSVETMNAVLKEDPPEMDLEKMRVSPGIERIVRHCLEKNPADRFQSARDLAFALRALTGSGSSVTLKVPQQARIRRRLSWGAAAVALVLFGVIAGYFATQRTSNADAPEVRALLPAPAGVRMMTLGDEGGTPVISPDGKNLVFVGISQARPQLFLLPMNSLVPKALPGTDYGKFPFWSPDSKSIGFFAGKELKRMDIAGGPPVNLAPADDPRGGTWSGDTILYEPYIYEGIWRVSASGGKPVRVTIIDPSVHTTHRWPHFLSDGKHFLYLAQHHLGANEAAAGIYVGSINGGTPKLLLRTNGMAFYSSGYLLYYRDGSLMAQELDQRSLELKGDATPLGQVLRDTGNWGVLASASDNGILVYMGAGEVKFPVEWIDGNGRSQGAVPISSQLQDFRLSPDGSRAAMAAFEGVRGYAVVTDLKSGGRTKLSYGENSWFAVWSPDGRKIAYSAQRPNSENTAVYVKQADGSGDSEIVLSLDDVDHPSDWSRDGKYLLVNHGRIGAQKILVAPLFGDRKPFRLFPSATYDHFDGRVSPNGKWIAYLSTELGQGELFITSFPSGQGKWQVSNGTATVQPPPTWGPDGNTLYFVAGGDLMEARLQTSAESVTVEDVHPLFHSPFLTTTTYTIFDVDPKNGKRFIGSVAPDVSALPLNVVTNWTAELKRK